MKRLPAALAALLLLLLSGCGGAEGADMSSFAPAEEDRLVIYTSHPASLYDPIIKEFEERTGIWVQVETGGTAALLDRLAAEREEPRCDLLFGGGVDSLTARKELFACYTSPLAGDVVPDLLCGDGSWTPFSSLAVVMIYNPVLVRVNPPEGWESLLNHVWRGRIAFADLEVSGFSYTALATLTQVLPQEDVLETFYDNLSGRTLSGLGEVVGAVSDAVAEGSCAVGVTTEAAALEAVRAGRDVVMLYPSEGTSVVADGLAVVKGCAHEENARRFIDFALGADVQQYVARECLRRPVRADLLQSAEETEELVLMEYDLDRAAAERESILARWREMEEAS